MSETLPNASPSEKVKAFVADLARPFVLYAIGGASAFGIGKICGAVAEAVTDGKISGEAAAIVIGAVGTVASAIFAAKALEVANVSKHKAAVETAAINAAPPANIGLTPTPPTGASVTPTPSNDDEGVLPADQRIAR